MQTSHTVYQKTPADMPDFAHTGGCYSTAPPFPPPLLTSGHRHMKSTLYTAPHTVLYRCIQCHILWRFDTFSSLLIPLKNQAVTGPAAYCIHH